ncbi:Uncharacterised protein [Serratia odorifera]|uniref:Uncharacterized protein n=1 Tax=Serratia odorifera TaxID=618 RepID=A0A447KKA2_SEROD|nr:Uncharacterised protein [Serratia odorifera]
MYSVQRRGEVYSLMGIKFYFIFIFTIRAAF